MKQIPINEASASQLRYHAETILGLEPISRSANRGQIIAKIEAASPGTTTVSVEDEAPESPAQAQAEKSALEQALEVAAARDAKVDDNKAKYAGMSAKQAAAHHNDPIIEIQIPSTSEMGGKREVPVAVGGVQFTIQRDKWVPVPYRVFEALKNAVETVYEPGPKDEDGRQVPVGRDVPSYPFSYRNGPSEAEIAEWVERTRDVELA